MNTKHGIKLSAPGFQRLGPEIRRRDHLSAWGEGERRNLPAPNPWAMMAETMLGNGDRAYEYYFADQPGGQERQHRPV
ncbi:MAG: hypothetical protein M0C28_19545 [Candidatus Moduliflexus flocculans]|nr:hypothetical protein [Candidatus Moduliflexus flocculans]